MIGFERIVLPFGLVYTSILLSARCRMLSIPAMGDRETHRVLAVQEALNEALALGLRQQDNANLSEMITEYFTNDNISSDDDIDSDSDSDSDIDELPAQPPSNGSLCDPNGDEPDMPGLVSLANDSGLELDANGMNDEHMMEEHDSGK